MKLAVASKQKVKKKKKKGVKEIVRKETEALDEAHHKIVDEYEKWERDNVYYGKRYTQEELEMFEKSRIEAIEFEAEMEAKRKERVREKKPPASSMGDQYDKQ